MHYCRRKIILSVLITFISLSVCVSADANTEAIVIDVHRDISITAKDYGRIPLSLKCPQFTISSNVVLPAQKPTKVDDKFENDNEIWALYESLPVDENSTIDIKVHIKWYPQEKVFRKWAQYRVRSDETLFTEEIILEKVQAEKLIEPIAGNPPQSYPVFIDNFYMGVEFPIAYTRKIDDKVVLAHKPGTKLQSNKWYSSHKLLCGLAQKGKEMETFLEYISENRPSPKGFHLNYNSWWTSSVPYTEEEILKLMDKFKKNLYEPYGISFDTFSIDLGWSVKDKVWEIDKETFPEGFTNIQKEIRKMDGNIGLWVSPSNFYSPASFDNEIAEKNGYETKTIEWGDRKVKLLCLGGEKYSDKFRESLVDIVTKYGVRHIKFDGYYLTCPSEDHGHLPGELSSEQVAMGGIKAWQALRKAAPDIWFETTCFGNPSPWWLFYVNSVIGMHGDDAPHGRVPCPVYRESYTTARDYWSLQGAVRFPVPEKAQEVLGIVHQTVEPFLNDGVATIMRGHMFVPLYVNPKYMNELRWQQMAELIKWSKENSSVLMNTKILLPADWQGDSMPSLGSQKDVMPRQVYGYSHFNDKKGLVQLRNPWIEVQQYTLVLDEKIGFSRNMKNMNAVSVYPQVRLYGEDLSYGDKLTLKVAPYETLVLEFDDKLTSGLVSADKVVGNSIRTSIKEKEIKRIEYQDIKETYGPNWTSLVGDSNQVTQIKLKCATRVRENQSMLVVLLESDKLLNTPEYKLLINGKKTDFRVTGTEGAWAATGLKERQKWMFLLADLPDKDNDIELEINYPHEKETISIWVLSKKEYDSFKKDNYPNSICYPEIMYIDSEKLIGNIDPEQVSSIERLAFPVKYIDGIYLDTIEPVSATQGWGDLEKNQSVWNKALILNGKKYLRGIGTHSNAHIVYDLGGKYKRFHTVAGLDDAAEGSIKIKILLDGKVKWESDVLEKDSEPEVIDLDVKGIEKMELIVEDAGSIEGDHADFADAILYKD